MHRDDLPIEHPCEAEWSAMEPRPDQGPGARFCSECQTVVHDLAALSPSEADALFRAGRPPCVRYTSRPDGTVMHRAPPPRRSRRRRLLAMAGLFASVPVLGAWYSFDDAPPPAWLTWLRDQLGIEAAPANPAPDLPEIDIVPGNSVMGVVLVDE